MKKRFVHLIMNVLQRFVESLARWSASDMPEVQESIDKGKAYSESFGYTEPDPRINIWLIEAAMKDSASEALTDPQAVQATLNGLLESCRYHHTGEAFARMLGTLAASGYDTQEAFYRTMANVLRLGMLIERRLAKGECGPVAAAATE